MTRRTAPAAGGVLPFRVVGARVRTRLAVLAYVRGAWGNRASPVTPAMAK